MCATAHPAKFYFQHKARCHRPVQMTVPPTHLRAGALINNEGSSARFRETAGTGAIGGNTCNDWQSRQISVRAREEQEQDGVAHFQIDCLARSRTGARRLAGLVRRESRLKYPLAISACEGGHGTGRVSGIA